MISYIKKTTQQGEDLSWIYGVPIFMSGVSSFILTLYLIHLEEIISVTMTFKVGVCVVGVTSVHLLLISVGWLKNIGKKKSKKSRSSPSSPKEMNCSNVPIIGELFVVGWMMFIISLLAIIIFLIYLSFRLLQFIMY